MRTSRFIRASAVASVAVAAVLAAPAFAQAEPDSSNSQDIVVTATKRSESVRDVAMPISAVTGEQLAKANANSLSDYIVRLPGVVFNDYQPGVSEVIIRGVSATTYHEQGQTTTGYYLNEIPLVEPGFPIGIPDVDTFDLDRVEVLRGPQGTLFGSSTLGGLVNYVVKTADTSGIHAAAEGSVGYTDHANGQVNYAGKLMLNVPIIKDKLAVRVMALQRFDAGFADNTGTGVKGSDDFRTRGLRGSIVFTPADGTKITYLSTYQETKLDDETYLTSIADMTRFTANPEPQKTSFFLNSLRLDQDLGFATFTIFGSVDKKTNFTQFDASYDGFLNGHTTGPLAPISITNASANIKQGEARLTSKGDGPFRWLIGTSYIYATKFSYDQTLAPGAQAYINAHPADFGGVAGSVLAPHDQLYGYISDTANKDFGVFGELSYRPVPSLEITVGGRYYSNEAKATVTNQAGYVSGSTVDKTGSLDQKDHGFTPKATVSFRPAPGFLAYMTYSRGYRVGGINPNAGLLPTIPTAYAADKVDNYEAGVKFGLLKNRILIDATVFSIDWKNIQAREFGPGPNYFSYVVNAASANIVGIEFSGTVKPVRHLSLSSNVTYQEAALTAFLPDNYGPGYAAGTQLPGSSKWSVANNAVLDFPEMKIAPTFELAHRYISSAPVAFGNPTYRGGFSQFDARASVTLFEKARVMAYINNIFDKRGLLNGPFAGQTSPAFSIIRPRTVGMRIDLGF
ncbi:TonB-dependent receptor [Sphingomonas oligophenolica]|uniref:TonB-dependent receptor n=1 Tax=Sphingomonas oligophenolica TaxID=301154 RepID=A0ABU9Y8Q0_9SPHN